MAYDVLSDAKRYSIVMDDKITFCIEIIIIQFVHS